MNLWDCKRPNGSKWHIRLGMIGSASLRNMFSMNRPTAWTDELALLSSKSYVCVFSHLPCKKLHGIRKPCTIQKLSDHCLQQPSIPQQDLADGTLLSRQNRLGIRWAFEFIFERILASNRKSQSLWLGFDVWRYQRSSRQKPYVAMFISNLITL